MTSRSEGDATGQGTSRTQSVRVPHLKAKLAILYHMSADIHGDAALGAQFPRDDGKDGGITGKAVQHWIFGDETREAGEVPAGRIDRLVEVFRKRLPGGRSDDEARALLLSPLPQDLLEAFQPLSPHKDWVSLMLEAPPADVRLVPTKPPGSLSITSRRAMIDTLQARLEFPVRQQFRLEVVEPSDGWLTLLQWGRDGMHGVEIDDGAISLHPVTAKTLLPLRAPYFKESEAGVRRFLFLRSRVPLPLDIQSRLMTSAQAPADLGGGSLERLAHLVSRSSDFQLTSLDVHFTEY